MAEPEGPAAGGFDSVKLPPAKQLFGFFHVGRRIVGSSTAMGVRHTHRMNYRVLGSVGIETVAGEAVAIGSDRQSAFVASMVARRGEVVSTDQLVELLWGDSPPGKPVNSLHVVVSRLRSAVRAAGDQWTELATTGQGYLLDAEPLAVDAGRFEACVDAAAGSSDQDAVDKLREGLALWHGRAYGHHGDTDVARFEAIRLEEMRRSATASFGAALVSTGRPDEATAVLEPLAAEYPLDERVRAELMRSLYAQGRHPEALKVFRDFTALLAEELGLEPSAYLRELELHILRHDVNDVSASQTDAVSRLANLTVRYVPVEEATIAWAQIGAGPRLVVVPAWVTSLDVISAGRDPRSSVIDRLASHAEVVMYDRRGTGLSRGDVDDFSVEAASRELEAVLRAAGGRASLLAMSQAGPTALALAARRPELVSKLVLFGTFASGPDTFDNVELSTAMLEVVRSHWGVGSRFFAGLYRPDASEAAAEHLGRVLYDSAPKDAAAGYLETVYTTDVSDILDSIVCPTLVIHYRDDRVIPFSGTTQLVRGIPDTRLLPLDGAYHLPDVGDLDRVDAAIRSFLAEG